MKHLGEYICEDFQKDDAVAYVPTHAHGDLKHKDVEHGVVSSHNGKFVFVKYFPALQRLGWDGCTSQSTNPSDLVKESNLYD
jgi:hypothetical protein